MHFTLLPGIAALGVFVFITAKRQTRKARNDEKEFWARENRANSVRRQSLDGLDYITIPLDSFPTRLLNNDTTVMECINILESLKDQKIVNLTGWTNTDLKLEYGTANITQLSEYDQNYTLLVRTLQKWADVLIETGYMTEACVLMEFAVSTRTDISRTYYQLAEFWASHSEAGRIDGLIRTAEELRSSNRDAILAHLQELLQNSTAG